MKRGTIIITAFGIYMFSMIAMYFGVQKYVESKDKRLLLEIQDNINSIFANRKEYIDIAYCGYKVGYERVRIPSKPGKLLINMEGVDKFFKEAYRTQKNSWDNNYGDLTSLFRTHYKRSDMTGDFNYEDGWNLCILEHDNEGVFESWIFPYAVGYKRQYYNYGYSFLPSVTNAVNAALEFYTSNNKSSYYPYFEKGCIDKIWNSINNSSNEYYAMMEDESPRKWREGSPLFETYPQDNKKHAYQCGFMSNGMYKVFIASTQPKTWTIKKYKWGPDEKDKKDLWLYWSIGLTATLFIIVIPLWIIDAKHKKVKEESIYDKLKRMCNPVNFISNDNYDKEKVDKANAIYKKLQDINANDTDALNDLQIQAVNELGVNLINAEKLADLKEKTNPKNYMNPYNPDKVTLANELYAILCKDSLTYNELIDVEKRAKQL